MQSALVLMAGLVIAVRSWVGVIAGATVMVCTRENAPGVKEASVLNLSALSEDLPSSSQAGKGTVTLVLISEKIARHSIGTQLDVVFCRRTIPHAANPLSFQGKESVCRCFAAADSRDVHWIRFIRCGAEVCSGG